jgi:hypothetical protein
MRSYIRHPSDIPIQVTVSDVFDENGQLNNVSYGGLAFDAEDPIETGTLLKIHIAVVKPEFEAEGVVTRCSREQDHYVVGIEFTHQNDVFVARMVEQICHIEHYKREVREREGRHLTGHQAAQEWIAKYAGSFPRYDT